MVNLAFLCIFMGLVQKMVSCCFFYDSTVLGEIVGVPDDLLRRSCSRLPISR